MLVKEVNKTLTILEYSNGKHLLFHSQGFYFKSKISFVLRNALE